MTILDAMRDEDGFTRRIHGVAAGIVTNNQDPDQLGRVRVFFPWLSNDNESDWARIATLMAGGDRGSFFLPEVGDEVLCGFEHGDINHPYVIGAFWNGVDTPPETNSDGQNNIRKFRSRSGHEIVFDDNHTARQEKVQITTNGGHQIILNDATGQEKIEIIDRTGSNQIVIDSVQQSISIESSLQLKIKSTTVEIEGTASLTIKSNGPLTIQGLPVKIN